MDFYKSRQAFTLSEVLITLGIIGVVTAITLPSLVTKYQEFVFRTKWKSEYSKIANAYVLTRNELEIPDSGEMFSSKEEMRNILTEMRKKLNIKPEIYLSNRKDALFYKTLFETQLRYATFGGYLDDKIKEYVIWHTNDGATVYFRDNYCLDMFVIYVFVDVNGVDTAPNVLGKDMFVLVLTPNGACPIGGNCGYRPQYFKNSCTNSHEVFATSDTGMHHGAPMLGIGCSAEMLLK